MSEMCPCQRGNAVRAPPCGCSVSPIVQCAPALKTNGGPVLLSSQFAVRSFGCLGGTHQVPVQ
uniref:Uncharacterized protein n=1 Tax=Anguilla anguilla TaxID=7936 RepID=A0A0E9X1G8_ANGAN